MHTVFGFLGVKNPWKSSLSHPSVPARLVDGKFQKATFFDESNAEAKALRSSERFKAAWDGHGEHGTGTVEFKYDKTMESHGFIYIYGLDVFVLLNHH